MTFAATDVRKNQGRAESTTHGRAAKKVTGRTLARRDSAGTGLAAPGLVRKALARRIGPIRGSRKKVRTSRLPRITVRRIRAGTVIRLASRARSCLKIVRDNFDWADG